jgi:hypothetical protein
LVIASQGIQKAVVLPSFAARHGPWIASMDDVGTCTSGIKHKAVAATYKESKSIEYGDTGRGGRHGRLASPQA